MGVPIKIVVDRMVNALLVAFAVEFDVQAWNADKIQEAGVIAAEPSASS